MNNKYQSAMPMVMAHSVQIGPFIFTRFVGENTVKRGGKWDEIYQVETRSLAHGGGPSLAEFALWKRCA